MRPDSFFIIGLTLLFIGLKLTGNIDWTWWWVLSPIWVTAAVAILLIIIIVVFSVVFNYITNYRIKRKKHEKSI